MKNYISSTDFQSKKKSKKKLFVITIIAIFFPVITTVVLVVVNFSQIKAYYSNFRSEDFKNRARNALKESKLTQARIFIQNAARHSPNNSEVWDLLAQLLEKEGSPDLIPLLGQRFIEHPTLKNAREFLQASIQTGNLVYVLPYIDKILDSFPESAAIMRLVGLAYLGIRQLAEAENYLQKAIALDPNNPTYRMDLATMRLMSSDPEKVESARRDLEFLSLNDEMFLIAKRSLAAHTTLTDPLAGLRLYEEVLARHPDDWLSNFRHFQLLCRINQNKAVESIPYVISKATTVQQKSEVLSTILQSLGPALVLETSNKFTEDDRAATSVTLLRIAALWEQGRLLEIVPIVNEALARFDQPLERSAFMIWNYRIQTALGQDSLATKTLDDMRKLGTSDISCANNFYSFFASVGDKKNAAFFLEIIALSDDSQNAQLALVGILNYLRAKGDTDGMIRVMEQVLRKNPENAGIQNNMANLLVNTGRDLTRALNLAESAYLLAPNHPEITSNYAHTLAVAGRVAEALRIYETLNKNQMNDAIKLYYAHTLFLDGQHEKAAELVKDLDFSSYLPEEKAILNKILSAAPVTVTNTASPDVQ